MFKNIKLKKALIGAGLGVLGVGTIVGTTWGISEIVSNRQNVDDVDDLIPGTPLIDGVEAGANDVVYDMPKQITFTRYARQATSDNTLTVSCTVLPADTINKKLTWTLQWADGGNHGSVYDYIKMSINSDTSQCTIQSLKAWTNKIKLVVKTTDGSNLSKECTLDYLGRICTFGNNIKSNDLTPDTNLINFANDIKSKISSTVSGGTLAGVVVIDQIGLALDDCGFDASDATNIIDVYNNSLINSSTTLKSYIDANYSKMYVYSNGKKNASSAREVYAYIENEGISYSFVKYHLAYNNTTYYSCTTYQSVGEYYIDTSSVLKATSLTLNDTSFIF